MITRPLDLQSRLSPPPRDLDFFAWVNVGLIVLFFGILGSRFVLPPGESIDVQQDGVVDLPESAGRVDGGTEASVVVSYRRDNVILFEGGMYTLVELRRKLTEYTREHPHAVMLVRVDRQVSVQAFLELCDMARETGFARVLAASERPAAERGAGE